MKCEYCGSAIKELFTSIYCPTCDSEESEDLSDDGTVLEFRPTGSWPKLVNKNLIVPTDLNVVSYLNQMKDYLIKIGYKIIIIGDESNNIDFKVMSPSGDYHRFQGTVPSK